jgi:transposase
VISQEVDGYYAQALRTADYQIEKAEHALNEMVFMAQQGGMSVDRIAELLDVSRPTVYRRINAFKTRWEWLGGQGTRAPAG